MKVQKEILEENPSDSMMSMEILITIYNIAVVWNHKGEYGEAITLLDKTLKEHQEKLGEMHPHILSIKDCLAASYFSAGDINNAFRLQQEVEEAYCKVLGENHPDTLCINLHVKHTLGCMHFEKGEYEKAIDILEKVWGERKERLGENHPNTLRTKHSLGVAYSKVKNCEEKAKELLGQIPNNYTPDFVKNNPANAEINKIVKQFKKYNKIRHKSRK